MRPTCLRLILSLMTLSVVPLYAHHGNRFLGRAMEMSAAEVQLAEMASTKAQSQEVRDFAKQLIDDHIQAFDKMRELLDARLTVAVPGTTSPQDRNHGSQTAAEMQLSPKHQRISDRLSQLSGADFDREFIDVMVRDHRQAINLFDAQSRVHGNGRNVTQKQTTIYQSGVRQKPGSPDKTISQADYARDTDTAEFAAESLPTLRQHLQRAESIQKELENKTRISAR